MKQRPVLMRLSLQQRRKTVNPEDRMAECSVFLSTEKKIPVPKAPLYTLKSLSYSAVVLTVTSTSFLVSGRAFALAVSSNRNVLPISPMANSVPFLLLRLQATPQFLLSTLLLAYSFDCLP